MVLERRDAKRDRRQLGGIRPQPHEKLIERQLVLESKWRYRRERTHAVPESGLSWLPLFALHAAYFSGIPTLRRPGMT